MITDSTELIRPSSKIALLSVFFKKVTLRYIYLLIEYT